MVTSRRPAFNQESQIPIFSPLLTPCCHLLDLRYTDLGHGGRLSASISLRTRGGAPLEIPVITSMTSVFIRIKFEKGSSQTPIYLLLSPSLLIRLIQVLVSSVGESLLAVELLTVGPTCKVVVSLKTAAITTLRTLDHVSHSLPNLFDYCMS